MRIDIITIFPEMFVGPFEQGIIRRAQQKNLVAIQVHNLRDFTSDKHQMVDDRPFGGGEGMVLKPEPLFTAVETLTGIATATETATTPTTSSTPATATTPTTATILLTPQGRPLQQSLAQELSCYQQLLLICGRYEGVDERVTTQLVTHEISIGDYVISGGELAAMVVVDAVVRLIPAVVGCAESIVNESFSSGILDCPVYTRPASFRGWAVPAVLQQGNHQEIARWRRQQALAKTYRQRPDLLLKVDLSVEDLKFLAELRRV
jgi:tRNA (guanine37-N1)-methyltransferase